MSNLLEKAYYNTWNIGFIEKSIEEVVTSNETDFDVKWVKHKYKDRFFADPFILEVDDSEIKVLVEEYPYFNKRGIIVMLTIDRVTYELKCRKTLCDQPYHQSYPFILRLGDKTMVLPEASQSGSLWVYDLLDDYSLTNRREFVSEPLLDSTIVEYEGLWYLFCTRRGAGSNKELEIFFSKSPLGEYKSFTNNPVKTDIGGSRPAGYFVKVENKLYRVAQVCTHHYGEATRVYKVNRLEPDIYEESFVKEIKLSDSVYGRSMHTLNGLNGICVVDGNRRDFQPLGRLIWELKNLL